MGDYTDYDQRATTACIADETDRIKALHFAATILRACQGWGLYAEMYGKMYDPLTIEPVKDGYIAHSYVWHKMGRRKHFDSLDEIEQWLRTEVAKLVADDIGSDAVSVTAEHVASRALADATKEERRTRMQLDVRA